MAFLNKEGLLHFIEKCIKPLKGASKHEVTQSLTTNTAGYVLDARAGKTLDGKIAALNADLEVSRAAATKTGNVTTNATVTRSGNIKLLKINTTITLAMNPGTDYSLCTLDAGLLPDTDVIKYVRHGKLTIAKTGRVTLNPEFALSSGLYLHIVECYI